MLNLYWICFFLGESILLLDALPLSPMISEGIDGSWYWQKYLFGLVGIALLTFSLIGCLCCNKNHRSKGFKFKEFRNERTNDYEPSLQHSFGGLELNVTQFVNSREREQVQFNSFTDDNFIYKIYDVNEPKFRTFSPNFEEDDEKIHESYNEWCSAGNLHLSRENLKYLRKIGQGWFGKVIEGRIDENNFKINDKIGKVVIRILSDEATVKEKSWFLIEAKPYFKLQHRNILALIGCCLETDPYLLIFESCSLGDLKYFLSSNRDCQSRIVLTQENVLTRMALDIIAGLEHMHNNGFMHTDLSARNCLVSSDLLVKLGDYGIGVEKYPLDYYVIGGRALPIRWSAPESLECSDTTIETREITQYANIWSLAILLWELITWGERPYDELTDEQVIQMLLSKSELKLSTVQLLLQRFEDLSDDILQIIRLCLNVESSKRIPLKEINKILVKGHLRENDFEYRWENLRLNLFKDRVKSASLKDLRGSVDSESWPNVVEDKITSQKHRTRFELNPPKGMKSTPGSNTETSFRESDSENEEESWRAKVECGAYTEKVKQKSKSVTDLMVLVHIDSDSDTDWSLGPQIVDKSINKKPTHFGSDGDILCKFNEFDQKSNNFRDTNTEKFELRPILKIGVNCHDGLSNVLKPSTNVSSEKLLYNHSDDPLFSIKKEYSVKNSMKNASDIESKEYNKSFISALEQSHIVSELNTNALSPFSSDSLLSDSIPQNVPHKDNKSNSKIMNVQDINNFSTSKDEDSIRFKDQEKSSIADAISPNRLPSVETWPNKIKELENDEELRILFELDSILDAECSNSLNDSGTIQTSRSCDEIIVEKNSLNDSEDVNLKEIGINCDCIVHDKIKLIKETYNDKQASIIENELSDVESKNFYIETQDTMNNDRSEINESNCVRNTQTEESDIEFFGEKENSWNHDFQDEIDQPTGVDISIRYNLYNIPLSPIFEEQESNENSESLTLRDESKDTSIVSKDSIIQEDLIIDDDNNKYQVELFEDRRESLEGNENVAMYVSHPEIMGDGVGEKSINVHLQVNENLISNFLIQNVWSSQNEEYVKREIKKGDDNDDDNNNDDDSNYDVTNNKNDDNEEDDIDEPNINKQADVEENSSSSGEFIYKQYNKFSSTVNDVGVQNHVFEVEKELMKMDGSSQNFNDIRVHVDGANKGDFISEEFTSTWDENLTPTESSDKTLKSRDMKKIV